MLQASLRQLGTKGDVRKARLEGFVPGIIYGGKEAPQPINVVRKELEKKMHAATFASHVHDVQLEGKPVKVLVRQVDMHPVKDIPTHIDFLRVVKGVRTTVSLPLMFKDEELSPGLKRGGVLNVVVKRLAVSVLAEEAPESLSVSLKGFLTGQSIHLSDINIPEGVKVLRMKPETTIATILAPSGLESEDAEKEKEEA